jgi:hypothetical protein
MLAAPALINRSMTNYWAGVSGKGSRIIPRWQPTKKRKHCCKSSERFGLKCEFSLVSNKYIPYIGLV